MVTSSRRPKSTLTSLIAALFVQEGQGLALAGTNGCDTVEAVVRTNQLFESSQVQVKLMIPKGETSSKKFDVVNDCNRVEYVRGSSSDDEAASFATHLLFKAQTQMREALCEEKRGGQLDDKRVNRIIKSNLKRIAENFYLQFGSLRTKMVAKTVDEVIRMQHQESPESRADLCPDDLWSDVVLLPSTDTQTEAARGWRSLSEVPFQLCKNLQIDWTKLPEVASTTAAMFLAEAAVTGSVDAAAIRTMLHLCRANYVQFFGRLTGVRTPWTLDCEHALLKEEHRLKEAGCDEPGASPGVCGTGKIVCPKVITGNRVVGGRDGVSTLMYQLFVSTDNRTNGVYIPDAANIGPSWCFTPEGAGSDEL